STVPFSPPRHPPHPPLHPFPTRRSSDLLPTFLSCKYNSVLMPPARSSAASLVASSRVSSPNTVTSACTTVPPMPTGYRSRMSIRSEEHTSELQSRENLVCRLLLEKKKIQ